MADLLISLNWLAVLIATILYFLLGALWYSPVLFASTWMNLRSVTDEDISEPNPVIFFYSFVLQFIAVTTLAIFMVAMGVGQALHGTIVGFGTGAGILFSLAGTTGIFSDLNIKLHFLDNGYHVIGLTISGLILGWWA